MTERIGKSYILNEYGRASRELVTRINAEKVVSGIGKNLEMRPLAYDVVNRLRGYLEADRVALGICRGKKCEIKGVSNQAVFDRRSNVLRRMEKLVTQIARTEESFHYAVAGQEFPPVLSSSAEKFLEVANGVAISMIPIFAAYNPHISISFSPIFGASQAAYQP